MRRNLHRMLFCLGNRLKRVLKRLRIKKVKELIRHYRRQYFALFLLIFFATILLLALVPSPQRIETQIVSTQFSFKTYLSNTSHTSRRRFLDSIRSLGAVSLTGSYEEPLVLTGKLESSIIGKQSRLEVELPYSHSTLQFKPISDTSTTTSSQLELLALQLQNQTSIKALGYHPYDRRLELQFSHETPPNPLTGSFLEINLGTKPLQLILEGYRLPKFGQEDPDGNHPLILTFQPDVTEIGMALPKIGSLSMLLPPLTNIDTLRWFWGNMPVDQVAFTTEDRRNTDSIKRSTIQSGKVRLGEQQLEIEEDQFLQFLKPGIQRIRYLKLIEGKGIEVRAMGKTTLVQVGLDPDFPILKMSSNVIARIFRPNVVVAIISFSGAMVASLLSWFVDNLFEDNSKPLK